MSRPLYRWRHSQMKTFRNHGTIFFRWARDRFALTGERGSILAMTAFGLSLIIAAIGVAIDIGHIEFVRRSLQSAADAAALAAALEARTCGTSTNCSAMQAA